MSDIQCNHDWEYDVDIRDCTKCKKREYLELNWVS